MGRPSNRETRRNEILTAFALVLAKHGYAGATVAAVAERAGVAPGLVHHHFRDKAELLEALLERLAEASRSRAPKEGDDFLETYISATLGLGERADVTAARCWVGLFAEALRDPKLFAKMRRVLDAELGRIEHGSDGALDAQGAGALLAFVVGSLVLGSFAPQRTSGFAAPAARKLALAVAKPRR